MSRPEHNLIEEFDKDRFLRKFLPGESFGIRLLRAQIAMLNTTSNRDMIRNVLICGPSGVGKNYVAKIMAGHRQWLISQNTDKFDDKAEKPLDAYTNLFAEVSLPGLPDNLVESELFGHEKGAFTGAVTKHDGYFREGYTDILLDEIGDASVFLQAKLLRVLNSGQYRPVGGTKEHEATTDARLLMATNKELLRMVDEGKFRADLLWRAREFVVAVPPLSEQADGVSLIAENILGDLYQIKPTVANHHPKLTQADVKFACSHSWPGNIRQLKHALTRWLMFAGQRTLDEITKEIESELERLRQPGNPVACVEEAVRSALDKARAAGNAAAPTLNGFIEVFSGRAKKAVLDWLRRSRPTPDELKSMFPGHKDANSIRTLIRKWGTPNE